MRIDPQAVDPRDVEMLQDLVRAREPGAGARASWRRGDARRAGSRCRSRSGGGAVSESRPEPIERLVKALRRLPGVGEKTATRLAFFLLVGAGELRRRARRGDPAPARRHPPVRGVLQPDRAARRARSVATTTRDARRGLRRRGAGRPRLDREHRQLPRPLPRARRHDRAARRRRPRGAARRRARRARRARAGSTRSFSPPTPTPRARPPRSTSPSRVARYGVPVTRIGYGMPIGGDLEYVDPITRAKVAREPARSFKSSWRARRFLLVKSALSLGIRLC